MTFEDLFYCCDNINENTEFNIDGQLMFEEEALNLYRFCKIKEFRVLNRGIKVVTLKC